MRIRFHNFSPMNTKSAQLKIINYNLYAYLEFNISDFYQDQLDWERKPDITYRIKDKDNLFNDAFKLEYIIF